MTSPAKTSTTRRRPGPPSKHYPQMTHEQFHCCIGPGAGRPIDAAYEVLTCNKTIREAAKHVGADLTCTWQAINRIRRRHETIINAYLDGRPNNTRSKGKS